tara:strand:+ start:576 stop:713 length:138 start_codon:yes stop_codon:yes gene_type:complete
MKTINVVLANDKGFKKLKVNERASLREICNRLCDKFGDNGWITWN